MIPSPNVSATTFLLALAAVSSGLMGIVVLAHSPSKRTHQVFALLTLNIALWSVGVLFIVHSRTEAWAYLWLHVTIGVASFLPATFYQFNAFFPYQRFQGSKIALGLFYAAPLFFLMILHTPWYVRDVVVHADAPPIVQYGPAFLVYSSLVGLSMLLSFFNLFAKLRQTTGIQRRQVEHVIIAIFLSTGCAFLTNVLAPVMEIGTTEPYGPCFMVVLMSILAYSMLRYHLLDVWVIVSRTTVYALVMVFVIATFVGAVSAVHWLSSAGGRFSDMVTTGLASLIIVLFIQPLKERSQLILDRLLLHRRYNAQALIERVSRTVLGLYFSER